MSNGIVITGSGFAVRQLAGNICKQDATIPLALIAANSMDEYNKPDPGHVISQGQRVDDLICQAVGEFAEQFNLHLFPQTWVTDIDAEARMVKSQNSQWQYDKLALTAGTSAFVPPASGRELVLTLNSQQEYRACEVQLRDTRCVLIVGDDLIGGKSAMDFYHADRVAMLIDDVASILASLIPSEVSSHLRRRLTEMGTHLLSKSQLQGLGKAGSGIQAMLDRQRNVEVDAVIVATGLRPEAVLARCAGLTVNRGVCVDGRLRANNIDIYALGDCAEINGQALPFLQPIQPSVMVLAKSLLGNNTPLKLPAMLVKIKTLELPLCPAGEAQRQDLCWQINTECQGMVARDVDDTGQLRTFMVSEDRMKEALGLLKALSM